MRCILAARGMRSMQAAKPRPAGWRLREGERRRLLILGDLLASALAAFLALALWAQLDWFGFTWEFVRFRAGFVAVLPAAGAGLVIYALIYFVLVRPATLDPSDQTAGLPRRGPLYFLALTTLFTLGWRWLYTRVFTAAAFQRRVLVVGAGGAGRRLLSILQ